MDGSGNNGADFSNVSWNIRVREFGGVKVGRVDGILLHFSAFAGSSLLARGRLYSWVSTPLNARGILLQSIWNTLMLDMTNYLFQPDKNSSRFYRVTATIAGFALGAITGPIVREWIGSRLSIVLYSDGAFHIALFHGAIKTLIVAFTYLVTSYHAFRPQGSDKDIEELSRTQAISGLRYFRNNPGDWKAQQAKLQLAYVIRWKEEKCLSRFSPRFTRYNELTNSQIETNYVAVWKSLPPELWNEFATQYDTHGIIPTGKRASEILVSPEIVESLQEGFINFENDEWEELSASVQFAVTKKYGEQKHFPNTLGLSDAVLKEENTFFLWTHTSKEQKPQLASKLAGLGIPPPFEGRDSEFTFTADSKESFSPVQALWLYPYFEENLGSWSEKLDSLFTIFYELDLPPVGEAMLVYVEGIPRLESPEGLSAAKIAWHRNRFDLETHAGLEKWKELSLPQQFMWSKVFKEELPLIPGRIIFTTNVRMILLDQLSSKLPLTLLHWCKLKENHRKKLFEEHGITSTLLYPQNDEDVYSLPDEVFWIYLNQRAEGAIELPHKNAFLVRLREFVESLKEDSLESLSIKEIHPLCIFAENIMPAFKRKDVSFQEAFRNRIKDLSKATGLEQLFS